MYHWCVDLQIQRALSGFPMPARVAMETQFSAKYDCRPSYHDGLFVYTYSGRGCFSKGGKTWDLTAETAYIISGRADDIRYYYPPGENRPWTFMYLVFKGDSVVGMMRELISRYGHIYRIPVSHPALEELRSFQHCASPLAILSQPRATQLVFNIINALNEAFVQDSKAARKANLIDRVQEYIVEHIAAGIAPGELAARFKCSREHLSRLFRTEAGMTPAAFILRRRLALAANLLRETRLSVKEIAARTGYEQTTNLIRAFAKVYGMTPGSFRRSAAFPQIYS